MVSPITKKLEDEAFNSILRGEQGIFIKVMKL